MANHPIRTGAQLAIIPCGKTHVTLFRQITAAVVPIRSNRKASGCNSQAKAKPTITKPMVSGKTFSGGSMRFEGKTLCLVRLILASTSRSK